MIDAADRLAAVAGLDPVLAHDLAITLYRCGRLREATFQIHRHSADDPIAKHWLLACIHANQGRIGTALEHVSAIVRHDPSVVGDLRADADLAQLWSHPGADDVLSRRFEASQPRIVRPIELSPLPHPDRAVYALHAHDGAIYVGGAFASVEQLGRRGAFRLINDAVDEWNPDVDGTVRAFAALDDVVCLVGEFAAVGGKPRENVAFVSRETGALLGFAADANRAVKTVVACAARGTFLLGGAFTEVCGKARWHLAEVSATDGQLTSMCAATDAAVDAMAVDGNTLVFAGGFGFVGRSHRSGLAALDLGTHDLLPLDRLASGFVYGLQLDGAALHVAGSFRGPTASSGVLLEGSLDGSAIPRHAVPIDARRTPGSAIAHAMAREGGVTAVGGLFVVDGDPGHYARVGSTVALLSPDAVDVVVLPSGHVKALAGDRSGFVVGGSLACGNLARLAR